MSTEKVILMFFATAFFLLSCGGNNGTIAKLNAPAPDFSYQTGNGTEKKLSDLKGKVVLITFFATWCGPCRAELPHIQKEIYNRLKDNADFELLIIGREHSRDEVNQFKTEQQFAMPFYPDEERKIYSLYAQQSIPRNFVVDKNGKIAYLSIGFNKAEFEKMKAKIDRLLAD